MLHRKMIIVACTAHRNGKLLAVNGKRNSIFKQRRLYETYYRDYSAA